MKRINHEKVRKVFSVPNPPFHIEHRRKDFTKAQWAGIQYEKRIHFYLSELYSNNTSNILYIPNIWLGYKYTGCFGSRYCEADGLLIDFDKGVIFVIEIKLRHSRYAYLQLNNMYVPLLKKLFPRNLWQLRMCEIAKHHDSREDFPVPYSIYNRVDQVQPGRFGVVLVD